MSEFQRKLATVYDRFDTSSQLNGRKLLFAHYTEAQTVESILSKGEIWFSNPLSMSDTEEMRWGIFAANKLIDESKELAAALASDARRGLFAASYDEFLRDFSDKHALDVYVFCVTEHDPEDWSGSLTMWRAYGASGNGAAIVFRPDAVADIPNEPSVLYLAPVVYANAEGRERILSNLISEFVSIVRRTPPVDDEIREFAFHLFQCVLTQSLLLKHDGFREEREWRLIYMAHTDDEHELTSDLSYHIGPRGPEPKLKFKVRAIKGMQNSSMTIADLVDRIIIGPGHSTPLAVATFKRIVQMSLGDAAAERVRASTIPFRAK